MESHILLSEMPVAKIRFVGKEGLPAWSTLYYMEQFCLNHLKLTTVQRICELLAAGIVENQLAVVAYSLDLFPHEPIERTGFKPDELVLLSNKGPEADNFWHIIRRYKRPVVLFTDSKTGRRLPLYDYNRPEAAKIWTFQEQSPPEGVVRGAVGAAIDLFFAGEREERERQAHANEQIGQATDNLAGIIRASQIIASPVTPEGVRRYAEEQLTILMNKQAELNRKIGLRIISVDKEG